MTAVLDELEGLLREATPRPWTEAGYDDDNEAWAVMGPPHQPRDGRCVVADVPRSFADAELIATAVNALPALLAVARAARHDSDCPVAIAGAALDAEGDDDA